MTRRKIGAATECPRCSAELVVPEEERAQAEVAMARLERATRRERRTAVDASALAGGEQPPPPPAHWRAASAPQFVDASPLHDPPNSPIPPADERACWQDEEESEDVPPVVLVEPPPMATWRSGAPSYGAAASRIGPHHRRTTASPWIQAAIVGVIGVIAFALGLWVGQSARPFGSAYGADGDPILIEGRVSYRDAAGNSRGDAGTVLIAIPVSPRPTVKLLTPSLAGSGAALADERADAMHSAGGTAVRADESGRFQLVVPRAGEYHVLLVSGQADRPRGELPREADLNLLAEYFAMPIELIGLKQYELERRHFDVGTAAIEFNFGTRR